MVSRSLSLAVLVLCSASGFAQTAGNYVLRPNATVPDLAEPFTVIDTTSTFTATGPVSAVVVRSFTAPCANAFKVKFFRESGGVFTPYAERGPFDITGTLTKVTLSPAVSVQAGDLLGVVALSNCAEFRGQSPLPAESALIFAGDVSSPVNASAAVAQLPNFALAAYAAPSSNAEVRTTVLVAAGSAQGAFGSSFRTDVFLTNPRRNASEGRLVFHPEGQVGVPTDPSWPYHIEFAESLILPNFVMENLRQVGKGSIDVYTTIGFEPPQVAARIYETSSSGTKGFAMDAVPEDEALDAGPGDVGVLFTPVNPSAFRMNMGYRTLNAATVIVFQLVRGNGVVAAARDVSVAANTYQQVDVAQFFNTPLLPGDTILLFTRQGAAYVYGSIIDNLSNDPSFQLARPLE
jgi:hypothetical protein